MKHTEYTRQLWAKLGACPKCGGTYENRPYYCPYRGGFIASCGSCTFDRYAGPPKDAVEQARGLLGSRWGWGNHRRPGRWLSN